MGPSFIHLKTLTSSSAWAQLPRIPASLNGTNAKTDSDDAEEEYTEEAYSYLSSPRRTMDYFLDAMEEVKNGDSKAIEEAIEALDLRHFDTKTRNASGKLAATRLIRTIDKIAKIKIHRVPNYRSGAKWTFRQKKIKLNGKLRSVEIAINKNEFGNWKFTKETVQTIKYYAEYLKDKKVVKGVQEYVTWRVKLKESLPDWMGNQTFIFKNGQWLALLLILLLALFLEKFTRFYLSRLAQSFFEKNHFNLKEARRRTFTLPFGIFIIGLVWNTLVGLLEFSDNVLSVFLRAGSIVMTVASVWGAYNLVDLVSFYFEKLTSITENKFDDILVPLVRKSCKVFVFCIGAIFIGHSLTLNVANILAGLGLGGLAFALAAKDTLSNLFGSLTVILDRPFQIGDWVIIGDKIEGNVEEVGFRSTRVRTFYNSLITVPNNFLTNITIDNLGKRVYRRYKTTVGIQYDTPPEKIEAFCEGIRQIILRHPYTRKDYFHVYFNEMAASSLNVMLYVFWRVPDWSQELAERHRLLIDILRLGKTLGVEFAFPTQTLHVQQDVSQTEKDLQDLDPEKFHEQGKEFAQTILKRPITMKNHRSNDQKCEVIEDLKNNKE